MTSLVPISAQLVKKVEESPQLFSLAFELEDMSPESFDFGQFNMLALPGVGEVAISIMGKQDNLVLHTIRGVGTVSNALLAMHEGQHLGIRGPFGKGWPLKQLEGRDIVFVTGGLGCAPVVAAINEVVNHQHKYGEIVIMQGVKHHNDLLWRDQYDQWRKQASCQVLLAASRETQSKKHWHLGLVTELITDANFNSNNCAVLMCGPEIMMLSALKFLHQLQVPDEDVYLSMERNFQCGVGHCGHCQIGPYFVCKDGPVFRYPALKPWLGKAGF